MKILMLLETNFPPDIRVEHEIETLVKNGHELSIACYDQKGAAHVDNWKGATIFRKPISDFRHKTSVGCLKFPFYFNFWRSFVFKLFKQYNFDAIHIHDLPLAQIGVECKRKFGAKFVLDLHENWPALLEISTHVQSILGKILSSTSQWKKYEQEMVKTADEVIVVIDENKSRLERLTDRKSGITVVSNTPTKSDIELFSENSTQENDELILFYGGGVTEHRGLQAIIEGISKIHELPIKFWVVGDGSYLPSLKKLASVLKVEDKVKFWGWKSLSEMTNLMLKATVLVIPHKKTNHTETTIPHKLFQYMVTEKPILATNCTPIERIINETTSGFIFKHNSIHSLIEELRRIHSLWKNNKNITVNGRAFVLEKYNWEIDEKKLLNIYKN